VSVSSGRNRVGLVDFTCPGLGALVCTFLHHRQNTMNNSYNDVTIRDHEKPTPESKNFLLSLIHYFSLISSHWVITSFLRILCCELCKDG